MWSSTPSSSTTISIKNNYTRPDAKEFLNDCCKDDSNFIPIKQLNRDYLYNIYGKQKTKTNLKTIASDKDYYCGKKYAEKEKLIKLWANKNLAPEHKTFEQIYQDDIKNKKKTTSLLNKFYNKNVRSNYPEFSKNSFIERSFCWPKIMCCLDWKTINQTKDIIRYLDVGVTLFLIDLRFGSRNHHEKIIKQFEKLKQLSNKKIFGLAFKIHCQRLQVGLMYKNQSVYLDRDSTIILTADRRFSDRGTHKVIYVNFSNYVDSFVVGDKIRIGNNDEIIVVVQGKAMMSIVCTVKKDGLLSKRMPIKIPLNRFLNKRSHLTREEEEDITLAISLGCNYLISNCITESLRSFSNWNLAINNTAVTILRGISFRKKYDISDIDHIFRQCDGVYISGESQPENYPLEEYIFKKAKEYHKIICRTDNIIERGNNKIHNEETLKYQFLYPDCIVFSQNMYDVKNICSTIYTIYPNMNSENFKLSFNPVCQQNKSIQSEFCRQIILLTVCEKVSCIIVINNNEHFIKLLAENRPMVPIIASFLHSKTAKNCLLSRNVYVNVYKHKKTFRTWKGEINDRLFDCLEYEEIICKNQNDTPFILCYPSDRAMEYCDTCRLLYPKKLKYL